MAALIPKVNASSSATAPLTGVLVAGELAQNKYTGRLYTKTESNAVVDPARVTLSGDITGSTAAATSEAQAGTVAATVAKIQGRSVASTAPINGETLAWSAANSQFEPKTLQVQAAKTAAHSLVLTDANTLIPFNASTGAAVNCTIPANSTYAFPIGTQILIQQISTAANQVQIVGASGVTLQASKTKTNTQWSIITLIKTATDTWAIGGDAA